MELVPALPHLNCWGHDSRRHMTSWDTPAAAGSRIAVPCFALLPFHEVNMAVFKMTSGRKELADLGGICKWLMFIYRDHLFFS